MKKLVLASGNKGKLLEIGDLLAPLDIEVVSMKTLGVSEPEETGLSFVENAILKARHASTETGLPALADDSGLEVDALQGEPGIYSARYAGANCSDGANNTKLLNALHNNANRKARYYCALALMQHSNDPTPLICTDILEGEIATEPKGDGGFGYDPLFYIPEMQCHAAELDKSVKNRISHRAKALQTLLRILQA